MPINSRSKGAVGERKWRDKLRDRGLHARRGQQFSGGTESPDVVCDSLPEIHFEVKCVEKLNLYNAMDQAIKDGDWKMPVVAHKKNHKPWLVTMLADDWLNLITESEYCV